AFGARSLGPMETAALFAPSSSLIFPPNPWALVFVSSCTRAVFDDVLKLQKGVKS
ncbi:Hypothetical predicted protein, partial [Olea europaea subsp. europaea]